MTPIITRARYRAHQWRARRRWNTRVTRVHAGDLVTVADVHADWTTWTAGIAVHQPSTRTGWLTVGDVHLTTATRTTWPATSTLLLATCDAIPTWERPLLPSPRDTLAAVLVGTRITVWWLWSPTDHLGTRCCATGTVVDVDKDRGEIAVGADTDHCVDIPIRLVTAAHVHAGQPVPAEAVTW